MTKDIKYGKHSLKKEYVDLLLKKAGELNCVPSFLITMLHFEGLWGSSEVAKLNNNWGGMTWTGYSVRPSGIIVSRGSKRPDVEGGNYMRYSSVSDFFDDWCYLLGEQGLYKVKNTKTFDESVLGLFKLGGAKYDYAASGYDHYLKGMKARRNDINNSSDGYLDYLDGVSKENKNNEGDNMAVSAVDLLNEARRWIGSNKGGANHKKIVNSYNSITPLPMGYKVTYYDDWCDTFVSFIAKQVGAYSLIGAECGVERHKKIFKSKGIWKGLVKPKPGDIVIFHWGGDRNGFAHHIGYVESFDGNTITTIEGNTTINGVSTVGRNKFAWNSKFIQGYARPNYGTSTNSNNTKQKTTKELAEDVLLGIYGNGEERKRRLGSRYKEVQDYIDSVYSKNAKKDNVDIEKLAIDVIAGKLGEGEERVKNLGKHYNEVQKKVNEMLKNEKEKDLTIKKDEAISKLEKLSLTDGQKNDIAQEILSLVSKEDIKKAIDKAIQKNK